MTRIRTYQELRRIETFEERYDYLRLDGIVGRDTFGFDRYLNQTFYTSEVWRSARSRVIARDLGCDLGIVGREIHARLYVHHMNPIVASDILEGNQDLIDLDYLITTTHATHNAIHYGDRRSLPTPIVERRPGDTKLW